MKGINDWALEAMKDRGISIENGKLKVEFAKGRVQIVKDLPAAIRQQKHIIDQQREEQQENTDIGKLMRQFHDIVENLNKMTVKEMTEKKKNNTLSKLNDIITIMERKREDLRRDGLKRLINVFKMLEKNNIPAAHLASKAALDRMRKRWLVNEKVIDKSYARLEALKTLSVA